MKQKLLCILFFLMTAGQARLPAAFDDYGRGARPMGMGGAFTAVRGGADAALFNPAGITGTRKLEASFTSSKLYVGLEGVDLGQNDLGCSAYFGEAAGCFALSWHALYTPALYREDTLALTHGRSLGTMGNGIKLSGGGSVKYLRDRFELDRRTENDPVFSNGSGTGNVSFDLGLLATVPALGLSLGLAGRDINEPDMGLKTVDRVRNENALGASYTADFGKSSPVENIMLAVDLVQRGDDLTLRAGGEARFPRAGCAVRAGYLPQAYTLGLGYAVPLGRGDTLDIDYAFALPTGIRESLGTHRLGLRVRFE